MKLHRYHANKHSFFSCPLIIEILEKTITSYCKRAVRLWCIYKEYTAWNFSYWLNLLVADFAHDNRQSKISDRTEELKLWQTTLINGSGYICDDPSKLFYLLIQAKSRWRLPHANKCFPFLSLFLLLFSIFPVTWKLLLYHK